MAVGALLTACSTSPEPIPYGNAECQFCRMTVVDRQHAAELVSTKGKVYFFDAIECMLNYSNANSDEQFAHSLVNDFTNPGVLIAAEEAFYLISKQLPSPMGAYLSAFPDQQALSEALELYGGNGFSWEEIQELVASDQLGVVIR